MPPRTLSSLAHALTIAPDADTALVALAEALADVDKFAHLALFSVDARRGLLRDRALANGATVERTVIDTTLDHLPSRERAVVAIGGRFVDFGDRSDEVAHLLMLPQQPDGGWLSLRGIRFEGQLAAVLGVLEPRRFFGTRSAERFAPSTALFELAFARLLEREARGEAVEALEMLTQRLHGEYDRKLGDLERQLLTRSSEWSAGGSSEQVVALEREVARAEEEARKAGKRASAVEVQVVAAVEELEKAHMELFRRNELLRQKIRTAYLLERVLALDATTEDPRHLAEGLLSLVGEDLHAQRCSLMLRCPDADTLYIAASRGIAPGVAEGARVHIGSGVAGKVAATREPLLVQDVEHAGAHPLLRDEYFTTGSFISFPLVYHGELVGVVNLTNRVRQGVFAEEDVERVRLLALVIALVAARARLPERLLETLSVG